MSGLLLLLALGAARAQPVYSYEVVAGPGAAELRVEATFAPGTGGGFELERGFAPFVRDAEVRTPEGWQPLEERDGLLLAPRSEGSACTLRYRFLLKQAASNDRRRIGTAFEHQGALLAPPSTWLLRPARESPGRFRLSVRTPPGLTFVSGLFPSRDGSPDTYEAETGDLPRCPYSGFGAFRTGRVETRGGIVEVALTPGESGVSMEAILHWVEASAHSVSGYFGRFPLPRALVIVLGGPGRNRAIGYGTTLGNGGGSIMVFVGSEATESHLASDWVLTHEMIHFGFPNLPYPHGWLEEGLATYLEPIARARARRLGEEAAWSALVEGMPRGLPGPGDGGLNESRSIGRTYWGGALYWLLADLQIRERTSNRRSLQDALRGILEAGGSLAVSWSVQRTLEQADRAAGVAVLRDLYERMAHRPESADLDALWKRLGIARADEGLLFDDRAPLAAARRAITALAQR